MSALLAAGHAGLAASTHPLAPISPPACVPPLVTPFLQRSQQAGCSTSYSAGAAGPQQRGRRRLACAAAGPSSSQLLYAVAEAATAAAGAAAEAPEAPSSEALVVEAVQRSGGGWLEPLTRSLEELLRALQTGLDALHVPYSYGFSIILLTLVVKIATFPLTKKQVESTMAVQSLKPRIDLIKARYGEDKDKISMETSALYKQAGVNPLAGCLPSIATIPIFIGLYSSLSNVANDGLLDTQGFFWIPSLSGPTTLAARQSGSSTAWLFPFVDGAPPAGWEEAGAYLSLPVMLVVAQYISSALVSTPPDPKDPNANTMRVLTSLLPLMVGWFSLNVPSGLGLYYLSNTLLTTLQQVYLRKLGGASVKLNELGPVTKPGSGRRTGPLATDFRPWESQVLAAVAAAEAADLADDDEERERLQQKQQQQQQQQQEEAQAFAAASDGVGEGGLSASSRYVKRKRLDRMPAKV